jgi:hypothetical protein
VLIVSAALSKDFDALVHYQDDDVVYSTERLVQEAKEALVFDDESESVSETDAPLPSVQKKPWWKLW